MVSDVIAWPVDGVAAIVNVVTVFGVGLADAVIETTSAGRAVTVTDAVVVDVSPSASTPVTTTRYEAAPRYVCEIAAGCPVNGCTEPSPQSTVTRTIGLAVAAVP